jgi:hypothetical protein
MQPWDRTDMMILLPLLHAVPLPAVSRLPSSRTPALV